MVGLLLSTGVQADLEIKIVGGSQGRIPLAVVPFSGTDQTVRDDLVAVLTHDLGRSGYFDLLPEKDMLAQPHSSKEVRFKNWRMLEVPYLLIGSVEPSLSDYRVRFELYDVYKGQRITGYRYTVTRQKLRRTAHQISDLVFKAITGIDGVFDSHVAYITVDQEKQKKKQAAYRLVWSDADGHNPYTILSSRDPLLSLSWSPNGENIAYVSYEKQRSEVYVQGVFSGKRRKIASFRGLNSAPSWSPDGLKLLLTLSRDGNPEIYRYDFKKRSFTRLTRHRAIDTEAVYSPDGAFIYFTSDRSGGPQIYRMKANGEEVTRITFEGHYNARAAVSPEGRTLALVHAEGQNYRIALLNLENQQMRILTHGKLDESPSFAPNGRLLLYGTQKKGRGILASVSVDGEVSQQLSVNTGDIREPSWAPKF